MDCLSERRGDLVKRRLRLKVYKALGFLSLLGHRWREGVGMCGEAAVTTLTGDNGTSYSASVLRKHCLDISSRWSTRGAATGWSKQWYSLPFLAKYLSQSIVNSAFESGIFLCSDS